jgi:long-chain acyl-CoA synthetase
LASYGPAMGITTIAGIIREHAVSQPDHVALIAGGATWTYGQLDHRSSQVANALARSGVVAQDRVAFLGKNVPEFFEVLFGAAKLNAVTVAVNWRLAPAEIAFIVNDARARLLVVTDEYASLVESLAGELAAVGDVIVVGTHPAGVPYEQWMSAAPAADPSAVTAADDVALQLYTSGTTGLPKGAMLTNRNFAAMLPGTSAEWGFDANSVNLVAMPLFHVGGVGWALVGMYVGAQSVLLREVDVAAILEALPRHAITHALFVPAVLQMLLSAPGIDEADFSSLRAIVYGASPISVELLTRCLERFGCDFYQGYGLTETTGAVVQLLPGDHDPGGPSVHRLRSAGTPMPGVELRVVDPESGASLPTGAIGEVLIRSPQVMLGYWNRPDDTAAAIDPDGWFHTGDTGFIDEDGYLVINDRVKDMIISGGENIYPTEVEHALLTHPAVADAAVIGVPSDRWGETPIAVIVPAPGTDPSPQELIAHCRERLATYKAPTAVTFVDELPRNPSGKVLKRELRAPYWRDRDRGVG